MNIKKNIVKPENETVVAMYDKNHTPSPLYFSKRLNEEERYILSSLTTFINSKNGKRIAYPSDISAIRAKAQCYEGDTFNEKIGVEIANMKLDKKYHDRMVHDCDVFLSTINSIANTINSIKDYHKSKSSRIMADLVRNHSYDGANE